LLEFECHRQESSSGCPPDLSSNERFLFGVGQIRTGFLIPALDHFKQRVNEEAQMGGFQNSKTGIKRLRREIA
jgi:hypothetical protein